MELRQRLEGAREELMRIFTEVQQMQLDLSPNEEDYNLNFISEKLAKVSTFHERISDAMLKVMRINIQAEEIYRNLRAHLVSQELLLKGSPTYQEEPLANKKIWLENQLTELREDYKQLISLKDVVSEVKKAVEERSSTMRRLDSDLRLHSKLYEQRVAAGAAPGPAFGSGNPGEFNLD